MHAFPPQNDAIAYRNLKYWLYKWEKTTHCCPEKLPISKIHVHLFLQLINVTLRQNSAIYVSLRNVKNNLAWYFLLNVRFFSSQIHTFLIVAVYWESRFWSMPSISLTRSQTTSVLIELSSIDGVPETTEAEPWYTQHKELLVPLNYITTVCIWKISEAYRLLPQEINHADF